MSQHYELMCVLPGTMAEDELTPVLETVQSHLKNAGAENVTVRDEGKKRLAYPMKHIRYGYFFTIEFEGETSVVPAVEAKLRLVTQLLRRIIRKRDPEVEAAYEKRMAEIRANQPAPKAEEAPKEKKETKPKVQKKKEEEKSEKEEEQEAPAKKEDIDKKLDEILDSSIANI